jgi:hypothetical protein
MKSCPRRSRALNDGRLGLAMKKYWSRRPVKNESQSVLVCSFLNASVKCLARACRSTDNNCIDCTIVMSMTAYSCFVEKGEAAASITHSTMCHLPEYIKSPFPSCDGGWFEGPMIQRYASWLLILAGEIAVVCSGMQVEPQERADDHNGNNRHRRQHR